MDSTSSHRGSTGHLSSAGGSVAISGMHHSLSTPAGVDCGGARTPPSTPKKSGKMLAVRVQMLDDSITIFQVQAKAVGRVLFVQVCKQLHLLEADYFGLEYSDDHGTRYWLDLQKPVSRQLGLSLVDPLLSFCVKFYTPDPAQLEEEYTRYLFCLQIKRDLSQGLMQCNENTAALMASYIVQAECGDFVADDYPDHTYLSSYKFVPQQDPDMERKIMENHKKHSGQSPAEADLNLLETARRCELYGVKIHPAKDHENVPLNLAVAHMGIIVFQNYTKINTFSWAKIRKISFKRKRFLIKLHPEGYGYYKDTVEFFFEGRNECKNFWKKCVENHGFFRCSSVKNVSRHKTRVLSRGSSFRYSGKTQKQIVEFVRDNYVKRQTFQRSQSFRHSSAHSSASNMHSATVGNSISAHPLLPLADSNLSVEASKLSASLGSMGVRTAAPGSPTTRSVSRHLGTPTSWSSVPDTRPTNQTTTSSLPHPPKTQSPSPETSATTSPLHMGPFETTTSITTSPLAVRAAVHRADTGTIRTHILTQTPSSHKSDPRNHVFIDNYPSQTQSQCDLGHETAIPAPEYVYHSITTLPKRHVWRRSASCKDLYDFSFEETGQAKRRAQPPKPIEKAVISFEERTLESPITRYDEHPIYSASSRDSSLEIHQDIMVANDKVYSSSYPGMTSYSRESVEDPGNYDLRDSQDDITHDSYELVEKSDDEYSSGEYKYRKPKPLNTRSCSLDSGNYQPSDSESELDKRHKCKSSSDVHQDIFSMEDPRDLPREIMPRKSDGSFYKQFKQSSRTSSLESKSDYYESKSRSSGDSSKKKRDRSFGSRTSSQESKSDNEAKKTIRKNRSADNMEIANGFSESRTSSLESKSDYYDAPSRFVSDSHNFKHDYDRKIHFERNYGIHKVPIHDNEEINRNFTHVHSISLQNVETEQNIKINRLLTSLDQNTVPRTQKSSQHYKSHVSDRDQHNISYDWHKNVEAIPCDIPNWSMQQPNVQQSTESESNIFSFDDEKIQSLQGSVDSDVCPEHGFSVVPNIDVKHPKSDKSKNYRDIFMEIEPRLVCDLPMHQPIERTKSDPNSLARQRLNSNSKRMLLMHQKSIDLTPAESSDEEFFYKQIPSAPPIMKYKDTHFEMPSAEFGHFDVLKREVEGIKTKFEVPKSQFEILGAKTQSDLTNLPPKEEDISYVLHKRHVNGTVKKEEIKKPDIPRKNVVEETSKIDEPKKPKSKPMTDPESPFLFTQNIDLSKVDPVTLEVDKTVAPIQHLSSPKRDITHIDPVLLETLNSKLSQIESDSPTSSKTESIKPIQKIIITPIDRLSKKEVKLEENVMKKVEEKKDETKSKTKIKTDIKPKRIIKPRMQPGKKSGKTNKTKVRITSFSSDDESLDSDDVFGSAEATPTRMEFSPPQMRKEMESILKFESERKYLQYTMSSTEVEGSPPTTRKKTDKKDDGLDAVSTELRRISERSLSIPSSEDEFNIKTTDMQPVFLEEKLKTVDELDKEDGDRSLDETLKDDCSSDKELTTIDYEREKEKELLRTEIENDLKDLRVPSRTKITEIPSPSLRKHGQSPLLFAHARLNLSEGSAFTLLQKQQALESPIAGRRAKSLDAPVISVSRLPPLNAFSSKDDTVAEEDQLMTDRESGIENYLTSDKSTEEKSDTDDGRERFTSVPMEETPEEPTDSQVDDKGKVENNDENIPELPKKSRDRDQIVPDVNGSKIKKASRSASQSRVTGKPKLQLKLHSFKEKDKSSPKAGSVKSKSKSKVELPSKNFKPTSQVPPQEMVPESEPDKPSTTSQSLPLPEVRRTKSQESDVTKKIPPKEKTKSLEKLDLKKAISKERSKSQEDSDPDIIAKRKEKQQMLYEIAMQQSKTLKSPVKDVLPVFPQVEEMVRERHGKLEISINTIEPNIPLEEAIIITKSPKKLDKMGEKLTKSLDLNLPESNKTVYRLGKSLDLDSRDTDTAANEFDFKPETIRNMQKKDYVDETSPETDAVQETVTADIHEAPGEAEGDDKIILEGTSLDVWLTVDESNKKLENIEIIQGSSDFFERRTSPKPPDLSRIDAKSSSDSQSIERISLGNSLDMKYIDESTGDSSYKSDQDVKLIAELQKSTDTVSKYLDEKSEKRKHEEKEESMKRITSEEESLTDVSELRGETLKAENLLSISAEHREEFLKLGIERSRSEDTGSWVTVECEEYPGTEASLDYDNVTLDSPEKPGEVVKDIPSPDNDNLLTATRKHEKLDLLKRSSDQSRSSDTTGSWTSGEKDISPGKEVKETDESSTSCAIGRTIGLSQTIETFTTKDLINKKSTDSEPPRSPRSPRSPRICVLGRAFTIDEGSSSLKLDDSSSDEANDIPKDLTPIQESQKEIESALPVKKTPYPFEQKWSNDSELSLRLHNKLSKKLSSAEKGSFSSIDDSLSDKRKNGHILDKPTLFSSERLSTESRNSLDTESSSGSLGAACRLQKSNDIPKELSSTWKAFPLDSSGSESFEDNLPPDKDVDKQEYFMCRDSSGEFNARSDIYYKEDTDITPTRDDTELPEDLANFPANFGYPCLTSMSGLGMGNADILGGYSGGGFLSRTLSRISERSTNSEKSSMDDDSTKASTHSDSLNDESMASSNPQISISSESPSNAHVSDSDKKTPKASELQEEADKLSDLSKPSDRQDPLPHSSLLQRQISDDRRTSAEMAELSMDDIEIITSERGLRLKRQGSDDTIIDEECFEPETREEPFQSSSQESEDWPLPEIPQGQKLRAMHEIPSSDTSQQTTQVYQPPNKSVPKTFCLKGSMSLRSQDSEQWPSPPSSVAESSNVIGQVETYYITPPEEAYKVVVDSNTVSSYDNDSNSDERTGGTEKSHTYENVAREQISESISESLSVGPSGVKIVLEEKSQDSNSDEELNISNLNDDVFTDTVETTRHELRPPTVMRRSTASDDSSHSHTSQRKTSAKGSHSSYSEEDCTSSMGTNLDDGTVRYALKPTKCTHSSHSEDTSIALSLSEWSNSTTTVKFQNLSSNSGTTKSSSGLKSDENSLTDIAQSISEWSSSNTSNTLKAQHSSGLQFQKLSSASTGDSTLTEPKPFFSNSMQELTASTRLGSSLEIEEFCLSPDAKAVPSPKNIPSEDLAMLANLSNRNDVKPFAKSTERPIVIPTPLSDTDKSSSSMEQRISHSQRFDKDKPKYLQKHLPSSKSTDRPVKVPLKLSKCSPYYSSSLSSESTPRASTSPIPTKTSTVPLTRTHRKPLSKSLCQAKSPPSEDSTSSVESPKSKSDRDRRGYRRKRQLQNQRRVKLEKEQYSVDEYYYVEHEAGLMEYEEYMRHKSMEEMASNFQYEGVLAQDSPGIPYTEHLEEGYIPDGDSQSGSDIFRMERDEEEKGEVDGFDVASIPPPLLEDDFENDCTAPI